MKARCLTITFQADWFSADALIYRVMTYVSACWLVGAGLEFEGWLVLGQRLNQKCGLRFFVCGLRLWRYAYSTSTSFPTVPDPYNILRHPKTLKPIHPKP